MVCLNINPKSVICFDELNNTEPVNVSKFVSLTFADDVKVFKEVIRLSNFAFDEKYPAWISNSLKLS